MKYYTFFGSIIAIVFSIVFISCRDRKEMNPLDGGAILYSNDVYEECSFSDTLCMLQGIWEPARAWIAVIEVGGRGFNPQVQDASRFVIIDSLIYHDKYTTLRQTNCLGTTLLFPFQVENHMLIFSSYNSVPSHVSESKLVEVMPLERIDICYPRTSNKWQILSLSDDSLYFRGPIYVQTPKNEDPWIVQNYYKYYKSAKP